MKNMNFTGQFYHTPNIHLKVLSLEENLGTFSTQREGEGFYGCQVINNFLVKVIN